MSLSLTFSFLFLILILFSSVIYLLYKGRMPVKFCLFWLLVCIILFMVCIFPNVIVSLANIVGFISMPNLVIGILFTLLFFICIVLTVMISGQKVKTTLLIQELSLLKKQVEILKKERSDSNE